MNSGESHPKTIQPQVDPLPYIFFSSLCLAVGFKPSSWSHASCRFLAPNCFRVSQTDWDVLERALHLPSALPLATSSANNPSQHGPWCLKSGNMLSLSLILITEALRIKRAKKKKNRRQPPLLPLQSAVSACSPSSSQQHRQTSLTIHKRFDWAVCAGQTLPATRVDPLPLWRQSDGRQWHLGAVFPWNSILLGQQTRPAAAQKLGDGGVWVGGGGLINPMTATTKTDKKHADAQMLHCMSQTQRAAQNKPSQSTSHWDFTDAASIHSKPLPYPQP